MKYPLIGKYTFILLFFVLLFIFLKTLSFYLVPVTFAVLLAMLVLPIVRWMESHRIPSMIAILVSLLMILLVFALIAGLFSAQVVAFVNDLPNIQQQLTIKIGLIQNWIEGTLGIASSRQMELFNAEISKLMSTAGDWGTSILVTTGSTLAQAGIMFVHFILFLLYRRHIRTFILMLVPDEHDPVADKVIDETSLVTQKYLRGVLMVMLILAVMNSAGLLILGIRNAIFFGVLAAILNIIPYVGVWIGTTLPLLMAIIMKDQLWYPLAVLALFLFTQFIDNNFLTPRITGSQVSINPLATLAIIIIGSMVWGVAGMVLFIPLLGIAKVLFDHVDPLKPYGFLIGDVAQLEELRIKKILRRIRKIRSKEK